MIKAAEFMVRHGMNADRVELDACTKAIFARMQSGLEAYQDTVPMIPTYLRGEKQVPAGRKTAVIDAGGTNFRTALVSFTEDGVVTENMQKHEMPGSKEPTDWQSFIDHTAECVLPLMTEAETVGFCFSYPATVTPDKDSRVINLTKQVEIHGAEASCWAQTLWRR